PTAWADPSPILRALHGLAPGTGGTVLTPVGSAETVAVLQRPAARETLPSCSPPTGKRLGSGTMDCPGFLIPAANDLFANSVGPRAGRDALCLRRVLLTPDQAFGWMDAGEALRTTPSGDERARGVAPAATRVVPTARYRDASRGHPNVF